MWGDLAINNETHETLAGPAGRRILEGEFRQYAKPEFERLAAISNGHLYNLRRTPLSPATQEQPKNTSRPSDLAERRCPDPGGRPGY